MAARHAVHADADFGLGRGADARRVADLKASSGECSAGGSEGGNHRDVTIRATDGGTYTSVAFLLFAMESWHVSHFVWMTCGAWVNSTRGSGLDMPTGASRAPVSVWHVWHDVNNASSAVDAPSRAAGVA